jgi:hypothetical protein
MKLTFFISSMALVLSGCASIDPIALQAEQKSEPIAAFATLSDSSNPADMAASVVYTRLAVYRRLAAKKLRSGEINVDYAKFAQSEADLVRYNLDRALRSGNLVEIQTQADILDTMMINLELKP